MRILFLLLTIICLCGCEATFPIGDNGVYGEAYVGYRLPVNMIVVPSPVFLSERTLRDK